MSDKNIVQSLYVTKRVTQVGKEYFSLCADLGYCVKFLSFDRHLCAEMLGLSVADMVQTIQLNDRYPVNVG